MPSTGNTQAAGPRRRAWPFAVAAGICLFVGFWGFAYQGYVEDSGMDPTQSWPIGAGGYLLGGVLLLVGISRARPEIAAGRLALIAACIAAVLLAGAIGAIDAGNP